MSYYTVAVCGTNRLFRTEVAGTPRRDGTFERYTIAWEYDFDGDVYRYECTCPSYKHRKVACKHIQKFIVDEQHAEVRKHCRWNYQKDKQIARDWDPKNGNVCPRCGANLYFETFKEDNGAET